MGSIFSVIVLHNALIHHIEVELLYTDSYFPPYSPDYNPIEGAFLKVKSLIKNYELDMEMQTMDMQDIILITFSRITSEDCQQWIARCGIYNT